MHSSSAYYDFVPQHLGPQQPYKAINTLIAKYTLIFTVVRRTENNNSTNLPLESLGD
jgi:hypothetical protein